MLKPLASASNFNSRRSALDTLIWTVHSRCIPIKLYAMSVGNPYVVRVLSVQSRHIDHRAEPSRFSFWRSIRFREESPSLGQLGHRETDDARIFQAGIFAQELKVLAEVPGGGQVDSVLTGFAWRHRPKPYTSQRGEA